MSPLVTIALSVYNGADTLKLAVESILNQTYQNWELIVINDGSSDNSLEVMRSFSDSRIRLVEGLDNMGHSACLNMAVDMAKGKYFARMDQDDVCFPQRIEKQLAYLQQHPEVDLLAANCAIFNDKHELLGKLAVREKHRDICKIPWSGFQMPHPTWIGKLSWFKNHYYKSYADGAEDQNLLMRSYSESCFECMDEVLLAYRQNERPLRKVFRARAKYVKSAFLSCGLGTRCYLPVLVLLAQLARGTIDFLSTTLRDKRYQRTLRELDSNEINCLQTVLSGRETSRE